MEIHLKHFLHTRKQVAVFCFLLVFFPIYSQDAEDVTEKSKIQVSGSINLNTNGISPVPAFSLDKPSIIGTCSVDFKRLSFNPEIAFSANGEPWFISPRFTYLAIDRQKYELRISTLYSMSYSYPELFLNGELHYSTLLEHYMLLQSTSTYHLTEKSDISLTTYHGFGMGTASIKRGNFFVFGTNFKKLRITNTLYYNVLPQLTYIDLDGETNGLFAAGTVELGFKKWPVVLSTQLSQSLATNIFPQPGFKWNVGLTASF